MKILIVGQTSSFWIKEYVVRALNTHEDEVYVLYDAHYGKDVKEYYEKKNVHLICTDKGVPILGKIPKVRTVVNLYYHIRKLSKDDKFDVIEFQGMPSGRIIHFFEKVIIKYAKKIVCMYWGSDILATPVKKVQYAKGILQKASAIVFDSNNIRDKFHEIFGNIYDSKIVNTRLGTTIFDDLNVILKQKDKEQCKEYFGIRRDFKVIAIGYNGRERQQHLKVLAQLAQMPKDYFDDVMLLLHLGYGLESAEYRNEIERFLENNFKNYKILDSFLNKKETAMLRCAVDIFIHAQISDALAGSIKEYLYAGAILINPRWIDYSECKELGIDYWEYGSWDELPTIVECCFKIDPRGIEKNRQLLYEYFSWSAVKPAWDQIHRK